MLSSLRPRAKPATERLIFDEYISDPSRPVPYYRRPISALYLNAQWPEWLVQDQRFVHLRPDVLSYETEPLKEDLDVAGPVLARLFASTSGTDSDWIVKLIDVYPEDAPQPLAGYQLMIANDVFRGRFRESFEHPEPIVAGQVAEYAGRPALDRSPVCEGAQDHGADSEYVVSLDRSQPAEVRSQYLRGEGVGLSNREPAGVYRAAEKATHLELSVMPVENLKAN